MKELFNEFYSEEDDMSRNSSCKKCANDKAMMNNNQNQEWMQNKKKWNVETTQWDMNQNTWKDNEEWKADNNWIIDNNCKSNEGWKADNNWMGNHNVDSECNDCVIGMVGLAQAYVPFQTSFDVMSQEKSLACGTIFRELVQPFKKGSGLGR